MAGSFATTHWSMVVAAARIDTTSASDALARLCRLYWYPLYAYVRRRGYPAEDAQDLTQEFFARLVEKNWVADADKAKGRFRTFLLTAMNHFLADEWDKARAQKRGGGVAFVALDGETAERRYVQEPIDDNTPERSYEKRWALTVLDEVLNQLRAEYEHDGKQEWFAALHPCLVGERTAHPYAELARALGVSEGTVKSAAHRMRRRYRQLLRHEIGNTLESADAIDDELRYLFGVLSR